MRRQAERAWHALNIGKPAIAETMFRKALQAFGEAPDLLSGIGLSLMRQGKPKAALAPLERAAELGGAYEHHVNLAAARMANADLTGAMEAYRMALEVRPGGVDALQGLASALAANGEIQEAVDLLRRHEDVIGKCKSIEMQAGLYEEAGDVEAERACLNRLVASGHDELRWRLRLAEIELELGEKSRACAMLEAILEQDPEMPDALAKLAQAKGYRLGPESPLRRRLLAVHAALPDTDDAKHVLAGAIGNVLDRDGDADGAFVMLAACHQQRAASSSYREEAFRKRLDSIRRHFGPGVIRSPAAPSVPPNPVFILGMPRCGSTLTEQILAAHPHVTPLGEWAGFEVTLSTFRPHGALLSLKEMAALDASAWEEAGRRYRARVAGRTPDAGIVTDKSLANVWHIGAIRNALPDARIIHVRRHPLDTCLSIYKANIAGALFDFAHDLAELGRYYRMYLELMAHWRGVLPAGGWLEIDYETLVTEPEATIRRILEYCGLPWDAACLDFHKARRSVRTASITQVRNPISAKSVGGWKRYEKHLQPLIRELGPEFSTAYHPSVFGG
ncbi:MAG: sulfotransferase [Mariprofundaceae bacterium]